MAKKAGTALTTDPYAGLIERLTTGKGKVVLFAEVVEVASPVPDALVLPEKLPQAAKITDDQRKALAKVARIFGSVIPETRRKLTADEITKLIDERQTLDEVKKLAEDRIGDIRTTVFNHLDVTYENAHADDESPEPPEPPRDKDGFYVLAGEARGTGTKKRFTRETRAGSSQVSMEMLRALAQDDSVEFSHKDFLAITSEQRVFDEHKFMLAAKKNSVLLRVIGRALVPGRPSASIHLR